VTLSCWDGTALAIKAFQHKELRMNSLAWLAVVLIAIWVAGVVFFKIVGFAIHLALIAAVVLLIAWAVRKFTSASNGHIN
jgi:membrane protein implicated in regulation of membrane protease activity